MIIGAMWYAPPVFGKAWMQLVKLNPDDARRGAAISFQTGLDPAYDEVGVVSYNATAVVETSPALTDDYAAVQGEILKLTSGGRTNIGDAVAMATSILPPATSGRTRVQLILTDGIPNEPFLRLITLYNIGQASWREQ
ncbi:MAG: VWA domain-containing protein [Candidatus Kerfeldbacteria bacterium]|nr:VWA domain-containing protein [Candidatus Kerfeldbacteria bacterium]